MFIEFKKGEKYALSNARISENHDGFNDCGYLLPDHVLVVDIDIDDNTNAQFTKASLLKALSVEDIKTKMVHTSRGMHLYFKRPENFNGSNGNGFLACVPVQLEYKHSKNRPNGITVKQNGHMRQVENPDALQDLPECLFDKSAVYEVKPAPIVPFDGTFDFNLFKDCVRRLKDNGYFDVGGNYTPWASFINAVARMVEEGRISKDQGMEIMTLIDDSTGSSFDKFTRAMTEPEIQYGHVVNVMKSNGIMEILNVCVDNNYRQSLSRGDWWDERGKFLHYEMADHIKKNSHVVRYGDESGILYYYDINRGFYKMDANLNILSGVIRQLDKTLTIQQVREVTMSVYQSAPIVKQWDRTHIPLKNGLWDIEKRQLVPFSPKFKFDFKINVNWNPDAYSAFIDETMNKISNFHAPTRVNLEECFGSIVSPELLSRYVWFLFGRTAHNGKSFFLYLISQLIDSKFIGTLSPHDVAKSQFKIAELYGKKVNTVDEVGDKPIPDFDRIKMLVTGGQVTIEKKGKDGFSAKLEVPQVWASNFFPNIKEEGNQVNRRLEIIPFDYNFNNDPNKLADTVSENLAKTDEAREYLLKLAIEGMYRLMEHDGQPSPNEKRNQQKQEFIQNNDKLAEWLDTANLVTEDGCYNEIDLKTAVEIYKNYVEWCERNEEKFPYGKSRFKSELMKRFNLEYDKKRLIDPANGKEEGNPQWRYILR